MATSHIASIRSSARTAQQRAESAAAESLAPASDQEMDLESTGPNELLARMSVISLGDTEGLLSESTLRAVQSNTEKQKPGSGRSGLSMSNLVKLDKAEDIDRHINSTELQHLNVLAKVEERWSAISRNLDETVNHLQDCSEHVLKSSSQCLQALSDHVGIVCDNVDEELKAFYHLMTKCDELTTKLSIASSFRDEIKALRKFVETLEQLYKTQQQMKTHPNQR